MSSTTLTQDNFFCYDHQTLCNKEWGKRIHQHATRVSDIWFDVLHKNHFPPKGFWSFFHAPYYLFTVNYIILPFFLLSSGFCLISWLQNPPFNAWSLVAVIFLTLFACCPLWSFSLFILARFDTFFPPHSEFSWLLLSQINFQGYYVSRWFLSNSAISWYLLLLSNLISCLRYALSVWDFQHFIHLDLCKPSTSHV